ncbi:MAG: MBL fold metallo-hydrolase [Cypionkella sp.]|uniref:MBL fold metallo-hydrolase n=1 Tax=Cypionkella sp. TaxID=2811411 RepID=UPI002AB84BB7|nr:MBL fold metallo-hydrolase [Cypionkella sp.]MDZ4310819.1 MBL fold metallo-hydrolase [Cypionkella sp.]
MASKFTSLPLKSGEAFLLQTDFSGNEIVILVDSGKRDGTALMEAILAQEPNLRNIDVAVCTHQDTDHANGFRDFADVWIDDGRTISEFWLPGSWAEALPRLLIDPDSVAEDLIEAAKQFVQDYRQRESSGLDLNDEEHGISRYMKITADRMQRDRPSRTATEQQRVDDSSDGHASKVARGLGLSVAETDLFRKIYSASEPWRFAHFSFSRGIRKHYYRNLTPGSEAAMLAAAAIDTAEIIHNIASVAIEKDILVRWFDFHLFELGQLPNGGEKDLLEPVNSVETFPDPATYSGLLLLMRLFLSRQNVESLVFYRPEHEAEPACLFLGDSRLAFGLSKPKGNFNMPPVIPQTSIVITAAHHGSRVNDNAYAVIDSWLSTTSARQFYVRNGGQKGQTLGAYVTKSERRCSQCVQCQYAGWTQPVVLGGIHRQWSWLPVKPLPCGTPKV